ncbi:MAG: TatD family deoxyribonuclease [Actinobacteria bacterium]|nr:TatD family deoxyribonuclease [Actinomycetota bacterium]
MGSISGLDKSAKRRTALPAQKGLTVAVADGSTAEWVDTHCHVTYEDIPGGAESALVAARQAGVRRMITIGTDLKTSNAAIDLANAHDDVWATVGLHPHDAKNGLDGLHELFAKPRVVAVGECGLDYYYDHSDRAVQREIFAEQITLANRLSLPLVIHTREAWDETFDVLKSCGVPERTIFHCFTGSPVEAKKCLDLGAYLSFSGIVTFKNADEIRAAAKICDAEKMLVETDSPFLAPVPHRGKSNQPAFLVEVGACLADVRGVGVEEIASQTTRNATIAFPGIAT